MNPTNQNPFDPAELDGPPLGLLGLLGCCHLSRCGFLHARLALLKRLLGGTRSHSTPDQGRGFIFQWGGNIFLNITEEDAAVKYHVLSQMS